VLLLAAVGLSAGCGGSADRFNTDQFWEKMAKEGQWRAGGRRLYLPRHVAWTQLWNRVRHEVMQPEKLFGPTVRQPASHWSSWNWQPATLQRCWTLHGAGRCASSAPPLPAPVRMKAAAPS